MPWHHWHESYPGLVTTPPAPCSQSPALKCDPDKMAASLGDVWSHMQKAAAGNILSEWQRERLTYANTRLSIKSIASLFAARAKELGSCSVKMIREIYNDPDSAVAFIAVTLPDLQVGILNIRAAFKVDGKPVPMTFEQAAPREIKELLSDESVVVLLSQDLLHPTNNQVSAQAITDQVIDSVDNPWSIAQPSGRIWIPRDIAVAVSGHYYGPRPEECSSRDRQPGQSWTNCSTYSPILSPAAFIGWEDSLLQRGQRPEAQLAYIYNLAVEDFVVILAFIATCTATGSIKNKGNAVARTTTVLRRLCAEYCIDKGVSTPHVVRVAMDIRDIAANIVEDDLPNYLRRDPFFARVCRFCGKGSTGRGAGGRAKLHFSHKECPHLRDWFSSLRRIYVKPCDYELCPPDAAPHLSAACLAWMHLCRRCNRRGHYESSCGTYTTVALKAAFEANCKEDHPIVRTSKPEWTWEGPRPRLDSLVRLTGSAGCLWVSPEVLEKKAEDYTVEEATGVINIERAL